jgi:glutathione peroxidase
MTTAYDFSAPRLNGKEERLSTYAGKVLLIVNTASQCGFTPQYKGLQALQDQFADKGFAVLGFPCNQFGAQEPGEGEEIASFCELNYGVTFPMFDKVDVNGKQTHPLWNFLKQQAPGALGTEAIKWNFTKFLVNKHGKVVKRYAPQTEPEVIKEDIAQILKD